ncbi:MAG: hypothetical protein IT379_33720, partial [Deltaproteobacteria bacterium]|nr:hypothetical protein [Deltaproteobacteria bacterium]
MGRGRRAIEERVERRKQARLAQGVAGGPSQFYVAPVGGEPAPDGPKPVDLLHAEARAWADLRGSSELVRFAFEGGDCAGVFDTLIEAVPLSPSALDPASFASQLYLDELVRTCFELKIDGRRIVPDAKVLRRVLETPPANAADCTARQRVLAELVAAPALRADLERLYLAVRRLRESLEAGASAEPNVVQRKIAVLVALQECVNAMADGFA